MKKIKLIDRVKIKIKRCFVRCLIWDFDGTLYRYTGQVEQELRNTYRNIVKKYSDEAGVKKFDELVKTGQAKGKIVAQIINKSENEVGDILDQNLDISKYLVPNPRLVKKIMSMKHYRHFILSNSSDMQIKRGLVKLGFPVNGDSIGPFEKIFGREEVEKTKPSLLAFRAVFEYTKEQKWRHLMIGDMYDYDLKPAENFGFQSVFVDDFIN